MDIALSLLKNSSVSRNLSCVLQDGQFGFHAVVLHGVDVTRVELWRVCVVQTLHLTDELRLNGFQLFVPRGIVRGDVRDVEWLSHEENERGRRRRGLRGTEGNAEDAGEEQRDEADLKMNKTI